MKNIIEFINEGKHSKKAISTSITKFVLWYVGCSDLNDFTKNDYYRKSLKDCAEGNDEWTFGYHALKSQFGGNFDRMYDIIYYDKIGQYFLRRFGACRTEDK